MKKLLMPLFGGILLTSSVGLTTLNSANTYIKQEKQYQDKKKEYMEKGYSINKQSIITQKEIDKVKTASKKWDSGLINNILNSLLEYNYGKLIINKTNLNSKNLPIEVIKYIDLALENLNNTIDAGYIKVNIINGKVKLLYPINNNINNLKLNNLSEIIEFGKINVENKHCLNLIPGVWTSSYGPTHWWRVWEWGIYIHFTEGFINTVFKWAKITCELLSLPFLLLNIIKIDHAVSLLGDAIRMGDNAAINSSMNKLSEVLGGVSLDFIGSASEVLATIIAVVALGFAIQAASTVSAGVIEAGLALLTSGIIWISDAAMSADKGDGVKWLWANFVFPMGFFAE